MTKIKLPQKLIALFIILISISTHSVFAQIKVGHIYYSIINDGEVSVTYCQGKNYKGDIVIPETIVYKKKTYKVTKISSYAFKKSDITSITLPNTITSIGDEAFYECGELQAIHISDLKAWCNINFDGLEANPLRYETHLYLNKKEIKDNLVLPEGITHIRHSAFKNFRIKSVTIPNSVKTIECDAFFNSTITSLNIGFNVTEIENCAFCNCFSLKEIKGLHNGIKIGERAIPDKVLKKCKLSFDYYANCRIIPAIKSWQKKQEFETSDQYMARVTKENQDKKVQELMEEAIKAYTKEHKITATLGAYDADNQLYKVQTNYGDKYVKVPLSSASSFKNNFSNAKFDANYYVDNGDLFISDLTVVVNNNSYETEKAAVHSSVTAYNFTLPTMEMPYQQNIKQPSLTSTTEQTDFSIDQNIPSNTTDNKNTFAVIIGNEKYLNVAHVPYANNDARVFSEYCKKTLGLPSKNVRIYENATYGMMLAAISDIKQITAAYNGNINVIFYYAGHGIPNESTKDAFLLPVDAEAQQTEACYAVSKLYRELGSMGAKNIFVFMDACFSGAQRGEGMLASARGVALKVNADKPQGNMVVFSAASGDETAFPYREKGHGLFTYYLLKKLRESKGNCTLGELGEFIQTNVRQQSVVINRKSQTPTIVPATSLLDSWRNIKLR